jgi:glycosyltransferase involved in cell wall biosynthesis
MPCTYDEPMGFPVLEAMANAVAVVQPAWGAFPELVESTGGGLLVEKGSVEALARGIEELWRQPELRRRLGEQGARAVQARHGIERMAHAVVAVYEEAAGRRAATIPGRR